MTPDEDGVEADRSEIFLPIEKELASVDTNNNNFSRRFYLADVEAIVDPIVVVPDIGSSNICKYFHVKGRKEWLDMFAKWLDAGHQYDDIGDDEQNSESEDEAGA